MILWTSSANLVIQLAEHVLSTILMLVLHVMRTHICLTLMVKLAQLNAVSASLLTKTVVNVNDAHLIASLVKALPINALLAMS